MADKKNKSLNPVDDITLQSIIAEIEQLAKDVVKDYEDEPSEMSGSITQVHESSPFLATRKERLIKAKKK
jgi:hypothetical protein